MSEIMVFNEDEIPPPEDFSNIGIFSRAALDAVVAGAVGYPHHWAGFTVAASSASTIAVTRGRLFKDAKVFDSFETLTVDLLIHLPLVTGDQRYVALLVRDYEETVTDTRQVETDVETEETVSQTLDKRRKRYVGITIQQGLPSPTPVKPAVADTECVLAFVLLSATGVVEGGIEMVADDRVKSLYEVEGRLRLAEGNIADTVRRTTTLETDLANVNARLRDIPRKEMMRQMQRDIAATRRQLNLPDDARGYFYDNGLLKDAWDYDHPDWLGRVREGIRFSYANERDEQLSLLDPDSADIKLWFDPDQPSLGQLLLPAWTAEPRIVVDGNDGFKNISQQVHTVTTAVRREIARSSTYYGPTVTVCENNQEWAAVADQRPGATFAHNGETFAVVSEVQWGAEIDPNWAADHQRYEVAQLITESWTEVYWEYITETFGVNGSVYGQTFLCAQPMITPSLTLEFTRVGTTGDVHLFFCETNVTGQPLFERVIVKSTVPVADLVVGKNTIEYRPTLLEAGRRYAWFTVTTGNHALRTVVGNKYAQGSMFVCSDGVWAQGSAEEDFVFTLNACKFAVTRTVVDFGALTLDSGMTELRLLYPGWEAGGTRLSWEVRPSGTDEWRVIAPSADNALTGLPALVQLRAVFLGTTDLQPAIVLGSKARGYTARMRPDQRVITEVINFGFSTTEIIVETRFDYFDPAHHTAANKLVIGSTVYTPTATTTVVDFAKPSRRTFLSTFTVPSTPSARVRIEATTDNVVLCPFIQDVSLYAI